MIFSLEGKSVEKNSLANTYFWIIISPPYYDVREGGIVVIVFEFQVLTKDSVTVSVDAVVYYRVSNATVSVANVENAHHSTRLLAQTTLRYVNNP